MRILVVEDQPILRSQVVRMLRDEGYAVDESPDGVEGLYKVLHGNYDLVVLDLTLPLLDGIEVLRQAREKGTHTPVMLMTARDGINDRVLGLDFGADDYIVKGFHMAEFKARVRAMLRRCSLATTNVIQAGKVRLDLTTKRVEYAGEFVELTGREYGILAALMRRLNAVVSREELYHSVIDETDDSMSNLLDVHVCNLRKKLGKDFVRTIRGRGYMVEQPALHSS